VNMPTAKEVFEAIGFTLGNLGRRMPSTATMKKWLFRAAAVAVWYAVVYAATSGQVSAAIPEISSAGLWVLFALGVFMLGAAAFCYVLFSFLMTLASVSPQVSADLQTMIRRVAHPLVTATPPQPESEGSFTPHDDERGYLQEQFEELKKAGYLNEDDNIDEVLGENKDFDFDAIKAKATGA